MCLKLEYSLSVEFQLEWSRSCYLERYSNRYCWLPETFAPEAPLRGKRISGCGMALGTDGIKSITLWYEALLGTVDGTLRSSNET